MTTSTVQTNPASDAELVARSLEGSRGAFGEIVQRYQTLVCSIAYCATGSVSRSQDVAQETFLTAWERLTSLREPEKLRGWLCGIVHNRLHRDRRDHDREPVHEAVVLDETNEMVAPDAPPSDQAVTREEEAILWRSLERIPALYREPLILFYREHRSVEQVAAALELTEDAVKQRLSRGRKLLQDEVAAFVENALRRTAPTPAFALGIVTLLPAVGPATAAAGFSLGANTAGATKVGAWGALLVPLAPFLGIAAGVAAHWLVIRDTTTDPGLRRRRMIQVAAGWIVYVAAAVLGEYAVQGLWRLYGWPPRIRFVSAALYWWLFLVATITLQFVVIARVRALRSGEGRERATVADVPLRPGTFLAVVAGGHLAMFAWLIAVAWRNRDLMGAATTAAAMVGLAAWAWIRYRNYGVRELMKAASSHLAVIGVVALLVLNLRAEVWLATAYRVTPAEAHRILPLWIIPVLSVLFVGWTALMSLWALRRGGAGTVGGGVSESR